VHTVGADRAPVGVGSAPEDARAKVSELELKLESESNSASGGGGWESMGVSWQTSMGN
jgi:hypothetical protein